MSGVDGSPTSSTVWLRESNGTRLNGLLCGAEVKGASSKALGARCSSLRCAPLADSKGVGLEGGDPVLPCFATVPVVLGNRTGAGQFPPTSALGSSGAANLCAQSPSAMPLLPWILERSAPMNTVPGLAVPRRIVVSELPP